jgi:hypothetical protein
MLTCSWLGHTPTLPLTMVAEALNWFPHGVF